MLFWRHNTRLCTFRGGREEGESRHMIYGKIVAGILGLAFLGIWGALAGVLVGHWFDRGLQRWAGFSDPVHLEKMRAAFFETSFLLLGHVAKADGRISESEIEHTEAIMRHLGATEGQRAEAIARFKRGAAPEFELEPVLSAFNEVCRGQRSVQHTLLVFLIGLALADDLLHAAEIGALEKVSAYLGYGPDEFGRLVRMIKAQHHFRGAGAGDAPRPDEVADAYVALGVGSDCGDRELKRAYRRLMSENHPDKLIARGVPEHMIKLATERSQEIQAAYELLKKNRARDTARH